MASKPAAEVTPCRLICATWLRPLMVPMSREPFLLSIFVGADQRIWGIFHQPDTPTGYWNSCPPMQWWWAVSFDRRGAREMKAFCSPRLLHSCKIFHPSCQPLVLQRSTSVGSRFRVTTPAWQTGDSTWRTGFVAFSAYAARWRPQFCSEIVFNMPVWLCSSESLSQVEVCQFSCNTCFLYNSRSFRRILIHHRCALRIMYTLSFNGTWCLWWISIL